MKPLRIDITQIPLEGSTKDLEYSICDLSIKDIEFTKPIQVKFLLKREINPVRNGTSNGLNLIHLKGKISGNLNLHCSRCLEDFKKDFRYNLNLEFPVRREQAFIDITEAFRQEIILNQPFKILCSIDCKGLCPVCGANLNKGRCNCKVNSVQ